MKTISISGQAFDVSTPYAAGHTLTEAEAKVLNQTRAENIGNNFRRGHVLTQYSRGHRLSWLLRPPKQRPEKCPSC